MRLTTMLMTAWICLAGAMQALPAAAQSNAFAPVIIVNGSPITGYEIDQRTKFLRLLNAPGDVAELAQKQLITDRLQLQAAKRYGIDPSKDEVDAGMKEFASRANMTTDKFIAALAQQGVAEQSYRAFVRAGVAWRDLVRAKFGSDLSVSKAEVNRALSVAAEPREARFLMSEIILPATPQYIAQSSAIAQQISATVRTPEQFAAAARQYSASNSAQRGGRIDWVSLSNLPAPVAAAVKELKPGQISAPVKLDNALGIFLVRAIGESARPSSAGVVVKYAQYLIPGGRSPEALAAASRVMEKVDDCDDLYGVAKGQPEGTLTFTTQTLSKVPGDIAMALAPLDQNEFSTSIVRGGNLDLVMLCTRRPAAAEKADPSYIANQIANQRLAGLAQNYLDELQADAFIRRP